MGTFGLRLYGEAALAAFARRHASARKPLLRFVEIVRAAEWPHFPAVKQTFPAADYTSEGLMIFDIGGNKFRVIARADFDEQILFVTSILTHEESNRGRY